jgi:kynurenine 3-monooxygenase
MAAMGQVLVVGGGLCGSLLAIFLARRGHTVDVFERFSGSGPEQVKQRPALNITLCERGLKALEAVDLREAALELSVPARGRQVHTADGNTIYQPYGNHGEAIYSVSRAALNQTLAKLASRERNVKFHYAQKCVSVDLKSVAARFEDTTTGQMREWRADTIFGADGAYSAVRAQMQKTELFNYSQQYWRFGGYKSLWIPGDVASSAALRCEALHIWPRGKRMLIGFPNRDGGTMLSLLLPFTGEDSYESLCDEPALLSFFQSSFPDVVNLVPSLAQQFFERTANPLLTIRCDPWSHGGSALLLGDAAHAILPSYGQGANAAFEDCITLDRCMSEHGEDWAAVFYEFERHRRPDLDVMADLCIDHFKEICELIADPEFLRKRKIERDLSDIYPTQYRSLYSMISFSDMRYSEALAVDRQQHDTLERIMKIDRVEEKLKTSAVGTLLDQCAPSGPGSQETRGESSEGLLSMGMRFWESKALLTAVDLGVFTELSRGPRSRKALSHAIGIHERGAADFLDALTALGLLSRCDDEYSNTLAVNQFLSETSPSYIGAALQLANDRLYPVWGKLSDALRSGLPQNEAQRERDYYANLSHDPQRLSRFLRAMTGLSMMTAKAISRKFEWQNYRTFADIGGAQGVLSVQLAVAHEHLSGLTFDLAPVQPSFEEYVKSFALAERIRFQPGDFFVDRLPRADVLVMGHVLHNWNFEQKQTLIRKAYDALTNRGVLIVYDALIDDLRQSNTFGLLMSLNMLLVTPGGSVYTAADCKQWMLEAGFTHARAEHVHGPDWMIIATKS